MTVKWIIQYGLFYIEFGERSVRSHLSNDNNNSDADDNDDDKTFENT